jgi:inhibitor of cysteine peptidase
MKLTLNYNKLKIFCLFILSVNVPAAGVAGAEIRVENGCSGQTIETGVNQEIVVSLKSNPATGYRWSIVSYDKDVVEAVREDYISSSTKLGAPGKQIFRFKTTAAGQTQLKLKYHRIWEKKKAPLRIYAITIIVF